MKCPSCDCHDTRVIDSRETADETAVRRRRQCVACTKRFTTYERWERPDLRVVKRDGRTEDFDRDKLEVGVLKACEKRPIPREDITRLIDDVEEDLRAREVNEMPTSEIGAIVLEKLKALDGIAYIRFASVYRSLDMEHLEREIKHLRQETLNVGTPATPPHPVPPKGAARRPDTRARRRQHRAG